MVRADGAAEGPSGVRCTVDAMLLLPPSLSASGMMLRARVTAGGPGTASASPPPAPAESVASGPLLPSPAAPLARPDLLALPCFFTLPLPLPRLLPLPPLLRDPLPPSPPASAPSPAPPDSSRLDGLLPAELRGRSPSLLARTAPPHGAAPRPGVSGNAPAPPVVLPVLLITAARLPSRDLGVAGTDPCPAVRYATDPDHMRPGVGGSRGPACACELHGWRGWRPHPRAAACRAAAAAALVRPRAAMGSAGLRGRVWKWAEGLRDAAPVPPPALTTGVLHRTSTPAAASPETPSTASWQDVCIEL